MTEDREQLVKEYLEWAAKFESAKNRLTKLLPPRVDVNARYKPQPWIMSEEMLIEYSQAGDEMDQAWSNMRAICDKITKLSK